MIKSLRTLLNHNLRTSSRYLFSSSSHDRPTNIQAPKVTEKLIWINLYNQGTFERIPAYEGETLLKALERFHVANIYGECGGGEELFSMIHEKVDKNTMGPFCTGCRVDIHEPWQGRLKEKHFLEERNIYKSLYPSNEKFQILK